jgi:hypothetical protein
MRAMVPVKLVVPEQPVDHQAWLGVECPHNNIMLAKDREASAAQPSPRRNAVFGFRLRSTRERRKPGWIRRGDA